MINRYPMIKKYAAIMIFVLILFWRPGFTALDVPVSGQQPDTFNVEPTGRSPAVLLGFRLLDIPLLGQQTNKWCWAASGEMIMKYFSVDVQQCQQASEKFRSKARDCCNIDDLPVPCVRVSFPQLEKYGFDVSSARVLKWPQLKEQIDKDKPVGFSWYYERGGGHYMVARGYMKVGKQKWVMVNDPWPHNSDKTKGGTFKLITYDDYVSYPRRYSHWRDHYKITRKTGRPAIESDGVQGAAGGVDD